MISKNLSKHRSWQLGAAGLAGATSLILAGRRFMRRPLPPQSGKMTLHGLERPVEIIRDRWGVAHIYAETEHDLFFTQGYVQAQDRLFQMDINRRVGLGRVSEITGSLGLDFDRFARYHGWPRAAQAQMEGSSALTRDVTAAFAAGINTFINQGPLPLEFTVLAYRPEPWSLLDSAAWGTVLNWGLSVNWESELLRTFLVEALGPEKAAALTPACDNNYVTTLPTEQIGQRLATSLLDAFRRAHKQAPVGVLPVGSGVGSNNWVVSGQHTVSGRPHLANDPHLPPVFPAMWYATHLCGGGYHVAGFALPGVPGVVIGHNEHVAWGVTNAFPDIQDIYIERFHPDDKSLYEVNGTWQKAEMVTETIRVRGRKPLVETVRYTRHGPVFSDLLPAQQADLALRWTAHEPGDHLRTILESNRAADGESFDRALRYWSFASQNVVYADTNGNIGYRMPGCVPRRKRGDGLLPVPGWTDEYEWEGWIPFSELPACTNPAEGYVATANNYVAGDPYPYLLTSEWLPDYRARRIRHLLEAALPERLSLADHGRIQNDTVSVMAERFLAMALPILSATKTAEPGLSWACEQLQNWDREMRVDSVAATLYFGLLTHFTHAAIEQALGAELAQQLLAHDEFQAGFPLMPFYEIAYEVTMRWLEAGVGAPQWAGDMRPLLAPALLKTLAVLQREGGQNPARWTWGHFHRIFFEHQMTRLPGIGRLWKPLTVPAAGDGFTVNQSDLSPHFPPEPVTVIASCRLIMDVGEWDACLAALPGGQSGQPASPHYRDRIAEWADGRYFPLLFSREKVEEAAVGSLHLE
jgi:penicillin amidase